jgi:hypothetical protein
VSLLKLATAAAKKIKFSTSTLATVNLTQVPSREKPDGLLIKRLRVFIKIAVPTLTLVDYWGMLTAPLLIKPNFNPRLCTTKYLT